MRVVAMQYTLPKRTVVDRNWVGLYRCMDAGALYFGKVRSAQACEAACLGHPDCLFWTYNASNAVIADTLTECWGGTRNVFPDTDSWHGFVSGGVMCEYPRAGLPPQPCQ